MTIYRYSLLILLAGAARAEPVTTPSGQSVTLYDVVLEPDDGIARFRYLAPAIDPAGQGLAYEDVAGDLQWLCETFAIPGLEAAAKTADHVIITLSDREVEFGVPTPEATQFIESYTIQGTTCIWDAF
jgi:Family of unknown function (DUF6497)